MSCTALQRRGTGAPHCMGWNVRNSFFFSQTQLWIKTTTSLWGAPLRSKGGTLQNTISLFEAQKEKWFFGIPKRKDAQRAAGAPFGNPRGQLRPMQSHEIAVSIVFGATIPRLSSLVPRFAGGCKGRAVAPCSLGGLGDNRKSPNVFSFSNEIGFSFL